MNLIETDVIICGAGISGLLMAKSLTNIGIKVACIEKYKRQKDNTVETTIMLAILSTTFFGELYQQGPVVSRSRRLCCPES